MSEHLALDLGTQTGYCHTHSPGGWIAGTWDLATKKEISNGEEIGLPGGATRGDPAIRQLPGPAGAQRRSFRRRPVPDLHLPDAVVVFSASSHVACIPISRNFEGVPVGTLKKFATEIHMAKRS